jgi:hypothetical protein
MEAEAWMALQSDWDLLQAGRPDMIVPLDPPGFLLGPLGATPVPVRRRAKPPHLVVPADRADHPPAGGIPKERVRMQHDEVRYADGTRALIARRK